MIFLGFIGLVVGLYGASDATNGLADPRIWSVLGLGIFLFVWGFVVILKRDSNDLLSGPKPTFEKQIIRGTAKAVIIFVVTIIAIYIQNQFNSLIEGSLPDLGFNRLFLLQLFAPPLYLFSIFILVEKHNQGYSKAKVFLVFLTIMVVFNILGFLFLT